MEIGMKRYKLLMAAEAVSVLPTGIAMAQAGDPRPNIVFIMCDDASASSLSCYGSIYSQYFKTSNIDRIANEGIILKDCYATNSISVPSRATIITGQYSHKNGVYTLEDRFDPARESVAQILQREGYATALVGKWHLVSEPQGFDYYFAMKGQGVYFNPRFNIKGQLDGPTFEKSPGTRFEGRHITDLIGENAIKWMSEGRDKSKPFFLMCHFKAPHRPWNPDPRFKDYFKDVNIPEPENMYDNYETRGQYKDLQRMNLENMNEEDLKTEIPDGLSRDEQRKWAYQIYIKDYLRCLAGVDENVGRILNYLDSNGLSENTIVIFTSDQGFFLGEHGWFDKRMMTDESIRMPFLMKYPKEIRPGSCSDAIVINEDFAPTFLDYAGIPVPEYMQGKSIRNVAAGNTPKDWRKSFYYRYWQNNEVWHKSVAQMGIRTHRWKLIFYYARPLGKTGAFEYDTEYTPHWELYGMKRDPHENTNAYGLPKYRKITEKLKRELWKLKENVDDTEDMADPEMKRIYETYYW